MASEPRATSVYAYDGPPHLELFREESLAGDGSRRVRHFMVAQHGVSGAVALAERDGALCFVAIQRRHAAGPRLELPRGFGEAGDVSGDPDSQETASAWNATAVNTAARELLEETGLRLADARVIAHFAVDSNLYPQSVAVVRGSVSSEPRRPTDGEAAATMWVAASEIDALVARGEITDAISLAALTTWRAARSEGA